MQQVVQSLVKITTESEFESKDPFHPSNILLCQEEVNKIKNYFKEKGIILEEQKNSYETFMYGWYFNEFSVYHIDSSTVIMNASGPEYYRKIEIKLASSSKDVKSLVNKILSLNKKLKIKE